MICPYAVAMSVNWVHTTTGNTIQCKVLFHTLGALTLDANLLSLNYDKTEYVHLTPKGTFFHESITDYKNKFVSNSTNNKFLGINTEYALSWKAHIDQLIPKLCMTCYAIRTVKPFMSQENLKSVYYSHFHSCYLWNNVLGKFFT